MLTILQDLSQTLERNEIPYMLSGSLALNLYTVPRMTMDIDVILQIESKDVATFVQALEPSYFLDDVGIKEEVHRKGMFNLIHKDTAVRIDCIVRQNSEYRQHEFERRVRMDVGGFEAYVTTIEDLILSKLIWIQALQSDKQKEDLRQLLGTGKADKTYLQYWIERLRINTFDLI